MYAISDLYKEYLKKRSREWLIKADIEGKEYGSNVIVDFSVENTLAGLNEFELGSTILSKLTIRLKTSDAITPNARIVPYIALQLPESMNGADVAWQNAEDTWETADYPWQGNVTEWFPLGEFFIDNREQINNVWTYTCYDKLYLADVAYISQLTYPTTMQAVWDEICDSLGYEYDSSVVIDPSYLIQAGPAGYSKRQVLGYIASANAACVYVSKDGILRFRQFAASDQPVTELTDADYFNVRETNPAKTFTRIVVTYNTEDDLSYDAGTGDENHTLAVENPFVTQEITNDILVRLNGFTYFPVDMDVRGYPQVELGDRVRYGRTAKEYTWETADVAWEDADFSWDGFFDGGETIALRQVFEFQGGLKMQLDAPSKSEQQSEFQVEGSLSSQINNLNKNAVKEGKSYFGATLTRTEGLTIEREDHLSKVVLNSDEMTFYQGNEKAIYFDTVNQVYKFNGTLEAADGNFSGSLSAADGTFTGTLEGVDGTFKGSLQAATGTFSGELEAATGTFNGLYSGTIKANQIDVSAGKITTAQIENLEVGGNVLMGPDARISWGQVNNIPGNVYNPSYIQSTYIDSTRIESPNIIGGIITGGSIVSNSTIDVTTDANIGKTLNLKGSGGSGDDAIINFLARGTIAASTSYLGLQITTYMGGGVSIDGYKVATRRWVETEAVITAKFG